MKIKSIGLSLVLWFAISTIVVVGISFFAVRTASGVVLRNSIRSYLISMVEENAEQISYVSEVEEGLSDVYIPFKDGYLRVDDRYLDRLSDVYSSLYTEEGVMIYGENPLIRSGIEVVFGYSNIWSQKIDGVDYEIYDRKINLDTPDGSAVWLRGIVPQTRSNDQLRSINKIAVAFFIMAITVESVVGYFFFARFMKPLKDIKDTAEDISNSNDLSQRIDVDNEKLEIKSLGDSFNRMLDKLENSFETEKQFTSDASHELRTPTAVILAQTQYSLEKTRTVKEYKEALSVIDRQASRMNSLVEDMLDYTRMDQNPQRYPFERMHLSELVSETAEHLRPLAEERGRFITSIEPDIDINGSDVLVSRAIQNLVSNAIRYGKEGGTISIGLSSLDDFAVLSVSDDGIGISKEDQEKIFSRFYRADSARSEKGTGLGLSMVSRIAQLHSAEVTVDSELGKGSTFEIKFKKI